MDEFRFDGDKSRQAEFHNRLSHRQLFCLAAYWFGFSFLTLPMLTVILPFQVRELMPEGSSHGSALGQVYLVGSLLSIPVGPIFGSMSDSSRNPIGRRRPFMVAGALVGTVALVIMVAARNLLVFGFGFALLCSANNIIVAPFSALVPDLVPLRQRGVASGWLGVCSIVGSIMGATLSYRLHDLGLVGVYAVLIVVHGAAMFVSTVFVVEHRINPRRLPPILSFREMLSSFAAPFRSNDFRVVFYSRFLIQMGIFTVQEFLSLYLSSIFSKDLTPERGLPVFGRDMGVHTAEQAVSLLFGPVLAGAFLSSMLSGVISDALGGKRKVILYVSGAMMSVSAVFFALTRNFSLDLLLGLMFGLGFGAFSVMDWAMACDVLPNPQTFATDMSLWALSLLVPQLLAPGVAGTVFDEFQKVGPENWNLGATAVFLLASVYFVLGTLYVKWVDHVD